jgi:hypothetical protein
VCPRVFLFEGREWVWEAYGGRQWSQCFCAFEQVPGPRRWPRGRAVVDAGFGVASGTHRGEAVAASALHSEVLHKKEGGGCPED